MASKQLAFLRHAKSSWDDAELDDFERPLNPRGRRAATRMGAHLHDIGLTPDLVLCSAAVRTRQTLERLELPARTAVLVEDDLYAATVSTLLRRIRLVDDSVGSLLMIGHNPGMHEAVLTILATSERGPTEYPTAALAVAQVPVDRWSDVRPGIARLESFTVPRSLD